jgi:hypothetical protein
MGFVVKPERKEPWLKSLQTNIRESGLAKTDE